MALGLGGSLVKGMIGGALKERAKNIGKTKAGKLLGREGRVMMGKPQPKAEVQAIQPQQTLAPTAPTVASSGGDGGGGGKFATEEDAALSIKNTTIQVATLLKGSYVLEKEQLKNKRKLGEKQKRKSREGLLEKAKGMVSGFKMPKMPGKGLLDSVFGFVGQLIFGMVMMKLVDFLPTLQGILPTLGKIADWIIDAGGFILNALATLINWGYKLVDGMQGMVKNIFGEEGAEKFKTFMTNIKDLIAGFLVWKFIGKKIFEAVVRNIKIAFNVAKSIVTNAWKLVNFITRGAAGRVAGAVGRGLSRFGGRIASKVMGTGAGKLGGSLMKKGIGGLMKRGALKLFGKTFVKAAGKIFGRIPIIGPLIVGIVSLVSGEPLGQALFKTFGAAIGGLLGTFIPIPIIGTLLGETIGVFVGDLLYHLIIKKDPKAAMKMLSDAIMGIFKAGKFLFNFVKTGVTNVIDNFPTIPIPDFRPGDIIAGLMQKVGLGGVLGIKIWNPFGDDFSILNMLKSLPGLQEVMGFFAQFIPGMGRYIEGGKLLAIPNLAMLTPLGLPFLTPLIAKSFLPGIFGPPTPPAGLSQVPQAPTPITADSIKSEEEKKKEEERKQKEEARKKWVEEQKKNVTGAIGGAWNWMTGGGKGNALSEKNKADKSEATEVSISDALDSKNQSLKGESESSVATQSTVEKKLKTANQEGGAKAVIESISTTASYEEPGGEVIVVPSTTKKGTNVDDQVIGGSGGGGGAPLVTSGGGGKDAYEILYKGG